MISQSQSDSYGYPLPGELGSSEKCNLLEAINLSLFNLNNEDVDLNLRTTGTQLIILSAGYGTYRINQDILRPTKARCLLGGLPITIVSF